MKVNIGYLADHPDSITILAGWLFEEWGHGSPDGTAHGMIDTLKERQNHDKLPLALVVLRGNEPVGTVSLTLKEVEIRPQYEHWLGTLFVHEFHRGKGIGSLLSKLRPRRPTDLVSMSYIFTRAARKMKDCM
jgi:predicted N-acetyltransferase YhbS